MSLTLLLKLSVPQFPCKFTGSTDVQLKDIRHIKYWYTAGALSALANASLSLALSVCFPETAILDFDVCFQACWLGLQLPAQVSPACILALVCSSSGPPEPL
jgi:hypothetical protein